MRTVVVVMLALLSCRDEPRPGPLSGLVFGLTNQGGCLWTIRVTNQRTDGIAIAFDASSYVESTGKSLGRLLRSDTKIMNMAISQPTDPVAAGATVERKVTAEACVDDLASGWVPIDETGTIHLVVSSGGISSTWSAKSVASANYWCTLSAPENPPNIVGHCAKTQRLCALEIPRYGSYRLLPCVEAEHAWCFTSKRDASLDFCVPSAEQCEEMRRDMRMVEPGDCARR